MIKQTPLRKARLHIVQALYQMDVAHTPLPRILNDFPDWQKGLTDSTARAHFESIVSDVAAHKGQLDESIALHLPPGWPLERLNKTLLAILRAGASEFAARDAAGDIAMPQAAREYVDVAYSLLEEKSASMANAVLDKIKNAQKE